MKRAALTPCRSSRWANASASSASAEDPRTIGAWFHEAAEAAGLPPSKRKAHRMRQTFATRKLEETGSERLVQELLNHSDLTQLHLYTAVADPRKRSAMSVVGQFESGGLASQADFR